MSKLKITGIVVAVLIVPIFIGLYSMGMFKFFAPMEKNIQREVFENTKSYLHAAQQDLGKYYHEYQNADEKGKKTIESVIRIRFAELDASKLQSPQIRAFLAKTRGY